MTATIALCLSSVRVKNAPLKNITIQELAKQLVKVKNGEKDGAYFIRTGVIDNSKGRSDTNTHSMASVLIIDADSTIDSATGEITEGAPCPHEIHKILKTEGINHFIYRSYSHGAKGNRYRIVLKTLQPYSKDELPQTVSHALVFCPGIAPVKENLTWSQPWYLPRKPEDDNSDFTYLSYKEGRYLSVQQPQPDFTSYKPQRSPQQGISPIEAYNSQHTIETELLARGDTKHGNKWLYAHSESNEAGISVQDNKMFSHHGSDPLNDGKPHDCFDVMQSRLGLSYGEAIKYAAQHTQAPNGQTVDKFNKDNYKHTQPATPEGLAFKPLKAFTDDELLPVLPVPFDALPDPIKVSIKDVSSRIGCAPDYLVVSVLTVLSSLLGRKVLIKPKQKHDWQVTPNLFGAIVGRPSTKKSPALNEGLYYINDLDNQARLDNEYALKIHKAEMRLQKNQAKENEKKAVAEAKINRESAIRMLADSDAEIEKPPEKRLIVHDATVEKFAVLLADNHNGLLTVRDEISGFLSVLDREENAPARAFYLQMFNGNQSYSYDRITRDSVYIPHCVGSILGGIQPAKLKRYLMHTTSGNHDDGLLQRFQLIAYPDDVISTGKDEYPDNQAKEKLTAMFEYFANLPEDQLLTLNFTQVAQQIFEEWENENTDKAKIEESPAMEAHLSKYPAFVASLALIIHLADNRAIAPVSRESLLKAIGLVQYFESHSRRIYGIANPSDRSARSLASNMHQLPNPFTASDFRKKQWSGLKASEDRKEALAMLVARGYLAEVKTQVNNSNRSMAVYYKNELLEGE